MKHSMPGSRLVSFMSATPVTFINSMNGDLSETHETMHMMMEKGCGEN